MSNKRTIDGWINLIKPEGVSSSEALKPLRKYFKGVKKVGHIGTLDPFASGVLPVAIGEATKVIEYISSYNKAYIAQIDWGYETDTLDCTGQVVAEATSDGADAAKVPSMELLASILPSFLGEILQIPPHYSANKVGGIRAYKLARKGQQFDLQAKRVECFDIKILDHNVELGYSKLKIVCGSGFYIRSLVRDIAHKLRTLATVKRLHRSQDGIFLDNCGITLAILEKMLYDDKQALKQCVAEVTSVLDGIPVFEVDLENAIRLKNGLNVHVGSDFEPESLHLAFYLGGLVAVCRVVHMQNGLFLKPVKGFNLVEL